MKKLSILCRKIHRYLTIPFVVLTLMVMIFTRGMPINDLLFRWQRILMLDLALTGIVMYLYPYFVKWMKNKG